MKSILDSMPKTLSDHIRNLIKNSGLTTEDPKARLFLDSWLKKRALFDKIIEHNDFKLVDRVEDACFWNIILLTYSGSLLLLSYLQEQNLWTIEYQSIHQDSGAVKKRRFEALPINFPLCIHQPLTTNADSLKRTSPVLSIAVQASSEAGISVFDLGKIISEAHLAVDREGSEKAPGLASRDDLFEQWIILSWFRTGGWEDAVFKQRAHLLWLELFSRAYDNCLQTFEDPQEADFFFLDLMNPRFGKFIDEYKWLESEKKDFDVGLMKALEEVPALDRFQSFLEEQYQI